jgi:PAS domain S-box-containing protein
MSRSDEAPVGAAADSAGFVARELLDAAQSAFASFDRQWRWTYINAAGASLFGKRPEELIGRVIWDVFPEAVGGDFWHAYHRAMERREPVRIEDHYPATDTWFDVFAFPTAHGIAIHFTDITANKRLQAATEESESRLRQLAENIDAVFWLFDLARDAVIYVSPAYEAIWGRAPTALYASSGDWLVAVHPDDRPAVAAALENRASGGYAVEYRVVRPNGDVRWIRDRGYPVYGADGTVVRIAGVAQDMTERHALVERLRQQRRAYVMLAEVGAAVALLRDPEELLREVCRIAVEAGGLKLAWVGRVHDESGEIRPIASCGETAYLEGVVISSRPDIPEGMGPTGRAYREKRPNLCADFAVDARNRPWRERAARHGLRSAAAAPVRLSGGGRGVLTLYAGELGVFTELEEPIVAQLARLVETGKQAIDDARRAELLARVVDQSSNLVMITRVDGTIEYVNERMCEVTGFAREEIVGQTPKLLRSPTTPDGVYHELWKTVLGGETWRGEIENLGRSGRAYEAAMTVSPLFDERGRITRLVGTQEDVTERNRMKLRLDRAARLESLGLLAGGIAHDFNNLLGAMMMYAQQLVDELPTGSVPQADACEIVKTAERAAGLTRQLLAFSRRQLIAAEDVDLVVLVGDVARLLQRLLGAKVELVIHPPSCDVHVRADRGQLDQVLINLCLNARDAMPSGGQLEVSVDRVGLEPADAAIAGVAPGTYGRIRVRDHGTGMTAATQRRIFEPFFSTKDAGQGTGLGLATSFGIVSQSGGHITVQSELGVGSTFDVLLPATDGVEAQARPREASPHGAGTTALVLLVDDEQALRTVVRRVLEREGYRVVTAEDGQDALERFAAIASEVALVVTDVAMPRMGGADLVARLHATRPSLPVLFMSGHVDDERLRTNESRAATGLLQKPFTPAELVRRVGALVGARGSTPSARPLAD